MDYFILKQNDRYTQAPVIKNWFNKIDKRNICIEKAGLIDEKLWFEIEAKQDTLFTDVITSPFLLVSFRLKQLIQLHMPNTIFKNTLLVDIKYGKGMLYYLPVLWKVDCLTDDSEFNLDKSKLKKIVIDPQKTLYRNLFYLDGVSSTYYVVSLDLAESMIADRMNGFTLIPIDLKGDI